MVFDFQPQDPESIYAALAALSGRKIPGKMQLTHICLQGVHEMPEKSTIFVTFSVSFQELYKRG